jgi:hypothetical protein
MTTLERYRHRMLRRTGKPHVYREEGEWLILERTGPGEWWIHPLPLYIEFCHPDQH